MSRTLRLDILQYYIKGIASRMPTKPYHQIRIAPSCGLVKAMSRWFSLNEITAKLACLVGFSQYNAAHNRCDTFDAGL